MSFFKPTPAKKRDSSASLAQALSPNGSTSSEVSGVPVKYDEEFLEAHIKPYLKSLSQYKLQEAQTFIKNCGVFASQNNLFWDPIARALLLLIVAEGLYHSLTHLELNRPQNDIKNMYLNFISQLQDAYTRARYLVAYGHEGPAAFGRERSRSRSNSMASSASAQDSAAAMDTSSLPQIGPYLGDVVGELSKLAHIRLNFVQYYRWLSELSPPFKYADLLQTTTVVSKRQCECLTHPMVADIQRNLTAESTVLVKLMSAQVAISEYVFMDAIMYNFQAQTALQVWRRHALGITSDHQVVGSQHQMPMLYSWLCFFNRHLNSSTSLYFHRVLKKMEVDSGGDFRGVISHLDYDYCQMIETFVNKTLAYCFCVILEAGGCKNYSSNGYSVPGYGEDGALCGVKSWPAIFTFPDTVSSTVLEGKYWPDILSILLMDKKNAKQVHYHHEAKRGETYFVARVDTLISLAVIFKDKKKENDRTVSDFMRFLSDMLRNVRLFQKLKPNHRV